MSTHTPPLPSTLRVLFLGPVRVLLGIADGEIACPRDMSTDDLWSQLSERFGALIPLRATIRLARNGEFLDESARVQPGDEIALIPPVSGG